MNAGTLRDPHDGGRIARAGVAASAARRAVILVHGRGGSPEDMRGLAEYAVFKTLGATVTTRIHPGAGHGVSEADLPFVRGLLE